MKNNIKYYIHLKESFKNRGSLYTGDLCSGKEHFNLQSIKFTFLSFFRYKARIYVFFHVVQDVKYVQS